MYLTLGNLESSARAAFLFLDFARGRSLSVAGESQAHYSEASPRVTLRPLRVMEFKDTVPFLWSDPEYSPALKISQRETQSD